MWTGLWDHGMQSAQWGVAVAASLVAASIDLRTRRIPNRLTGPVLLLGLLWAWAVAGGSGLADGLCGALVVGAPFVALWMMQAGGAGDAKMMMALGAWLGLINGTLALLAVALAGGAVSLGYAIRRRHLGSALGNVLGVIVCALCLPFAGRPVRQDLIPSIKSPRAFPYGLAIFLGTSLAAAGALWWRM